MSSVGPSAFQLSSCKAVVIICLHVSKKSHFKAIGISFYIRLYIHFVYFFSSPVGSSCHTRGVVRRQAYVVSFASTITTRNNQIHIWCKCLSCSWIVLVAPPSLAIKSWLKNQIFTFLTSSLKPPADGASYYARRFPRPRPS